eukprot:116752-Rhodomonas_salina.2
MLVPDHTLTQYCASRSIIGHASTRQCGPYAMLVHSSIDSSTVPLPRISRLPPPSRGGAAARSWSIAEISTAHNADQYRAWRSSGVADREGPTRDSARSPVARVAQTVPLAP